MWDICSIAIVDDHVLVLLDESFFQCRLRNEYFYDEYLHHYPRPANSVDVQKYPDHVGILIRVYVGNYRVAILIFGGGRLQMIQGDDYDVNVLIVKSSVWIHEESGSERLVRQ